MMAEFNERYQLTKIESCDVSCVFDLETDSYPADEAATLDKIQYRSEEATQYFLVLKDHNRVIVGFVNGTCVAGGTIEHCSMAEHDPQGRTLVIHSVTVNKSHRRHGIATKMLTKYLETIYALKTVDRVLLLSKSYLLPLYLNVGFQFIRLSPVEHGQVCFHQSSVSQSRSTDVGVIFFVLRSFLRVLGISFFDCLF
jgi:ribosomal protein S18 acetylase RimI-like enzyme